MFRSSGTEVEVLRDVESILIPDGVLTTISQGEKVFIQQVLGGMFTVQTDKGYLMRIDGKDADALGQPVPTERRRISEEEVELKGIKLCIEEQLKTCYDPEIPVNIYDLGLIYDCQIAPADNRGLLFLVRIEMTLTAPGCGMGEILKSDVEKKLRDIPGVQDVVVDLVFDPPWDSNLMSEAAKLSLGFL